MKTLQSLLYAFIAMFVLAGCNDDGDFLSGAPENPDCYYVYFPLTGESTDLELDPADETKVTIKVRRLKSDDAITVPVTVKSNVADIFQASEIKFADGQDETTLDVTFPNSEIGTTYSCEISIEDPKYASVYGEKPAGTKFSVTRVKWNLLTGPNGETTGKWRDDLGTAYFGGNLRGTPNAEKDVEIYERADNPGYYRIKDIYDEDFLFGTLLGVRYSNVHSVPTYTIIDATDKAKVWFPVQKAGYSLDDLGEEFVIVSFCKENYPDMESATKYGTLKDGILTFPSESILLSLPSKWEATSYYVANSSMTRLMLPGVKAYDYSLAITNSEPVDGVVKLGFKFGGDVAKVQYAFFSGALTDAVAESKSKEIDEGAVPSKNITESGTVDAVLDETGIYSVVGNIYDKDGALQGCQYKTFGYVKAGDEKPVLLTVRAGLTWQYEAEGYTPENSVLGTMFGQDIESAYMGLFKSADLDGMTAAQLEQVVKKNGKAVTAENLEKINGSGYSPLFTGLAGGQSYTLLVWAFNGYHGEVFTAEQTTQGDPSPLDVIYTFDDAAAYVPKADLFNTTWNYYAIDDAKGKTSRQYLGKVTVSENPNDGVDEEGKPLDYINIMGLSTLGANPNFTGDDSMLASWGGSGLIYPNALSDLGRYGGKYYVTNFFTWEEKATGLHTIDFALIGVYVDEGIIAFVPNPSYVDMNYTFTGMYFGAFNDSEYQDQEGYLAIYKHLLLVDPAVDPSGKTVAAVAQKLDGLKPPTNFVELRGPALVKAIQTELNGSPKNQADQMLSVDTPVTAAVDARVSFTPGTPNVRPVSTTEVKRLINKTAVIK